MQLRRAGWRESGHQTVVIPDLFDYLFLRSNAQAVLGTKNSIAVRCPQLEAYHDTSGTAVNFRNVTLNVFLQNNSNRCVLSNRALKCKMHIMSDSAGTNISKTNCIPLSEKNLAALST